MQPDNVPKQIKVAIAEALQLLQSTHWQHGRTSQKSPDPLPSLLEQCGELFHADKTDEPEPIRTIHHFAGSGGTLVSKCLAAMPNSQVLSEVNPYSGLAFHGGRFFPTDLIRLVKAGSRGADDSLVASIFLGGLREVYDDCNRKGLYLILRDHSHGQYCLGSEVPKTPALRTLLRTEYPCLSVVTVRNPVDSYLSLIANGWRHFTPFSLDEYCRRYECFLDDHNDVTIYRYEELVENSVETMQCICSTLKISFVTGFEEIFPVHTLSGDSGRKGNRIEYRERRSIPEKVKKEIDDSVLLPRLFDRLGYKY